MATDFPILFTVGQSNRHDVVSLSPSDSLSDISRRIESLIAASPNCKEALAQYSKQKGKQVVKGIKIRWSGEPREARLWPGSGTILTEENSAAALELARMHQGRDVLEVEAVQEGGRQTEQEGEKTEGKGEE